MNCMKCGRDTIGENVFCSDCLAEMEKYPVQPGTAILLPRRRETASAKKAVKRRGLTPEEQITGLRRWVIRLALVLIVCIVAIILMFKPTMVYLSEEHYDIGQNYSSVSPTIQETTD